MDFIDYYKLLELDKNADESDIKKAYRKLARKYHPDLNPNDKVANAKFQQINEANGVLSDPEKRKKYDKFGKDWKHADANAASQQYSSNQGRPDSSGSYSEQDFSEFFGSMFGGGGQGRRQTKFRGQDLHAELHLSLEAAYLSQKQTLTVNGKNIRLTIPAGIENGQTIKITGQGGDGMNGGPKGDLYIKFAITNQTKFKRDGNNLYTTVNLDLYTAILGGETTIDTFSGKVKLKIQPETQAGAKVRLKGKGFPLYKKEGEFGDLIITYNVKTPKNLSEKEKELFKELSKLRHEN